MSRGDYVQRVNEGATADVDALFGVFFQDGYLPRVLAELRVTIHVNGVLDTTVNALRMSGTAGVLVYCWSWRSERSATANVTGSAGLGSSSVVGLTLQKIYMIYLLYPKQIQWGTLTVTTAWVVVG